MTCCSGSASTEASRTEASKLKLEFLFLDETICKPCGGTGKALDEAVGIVAGPLAALGKTLEVERVHIATRQDAITHRLAMSPTIRINGVDIDPDQTQGACGSCGEIAGGRTTVDCRTWRWKGEVHSAAPTGKIVEAILRSATSVGENPTACCTRPGEADDYSLSENLEGFFVARDKGEAGCC